MVNDIISIETKIYVIRNQKVMLDSDLAILYEVETGALNRTVKRNRERFPDDFMFQLKRNELDNLKCQIGISSSWGGRRRSLPYVFTEHGVAMLSSVLRSNKAILVNIEIMRAFARLRGILASHKELAQKLEELEQCYDEQFRTVFDVIRQLMSTDETTKRRIGFRAEDSKK